MVIPLLLPIVQPNASQATTHTPALVESPVVPKSLPVSILKPVDPPLTHLTPIPVPVATSTPEVAYTAPPAPTPAPPPPVLDSSFNADKLFIYQKESGNRTWAVNPGSGACGLGQALPCSKMGCSLQDYACQDAFFTRYATERYGSWHGAYLFWIGHNYW